MSLIQDRIIFYIDSNNRMAGTNSNFTYNLNTPLSNIQGFDRVVVLQATIPKTFYIVNSPFNTFTLIENGVQSTVTVPIGNYNRKSFGLSCASALTLASTHSLVYTITYPNSSTQVDQGYYTISVTNPSNYPLSISFPSTSYIYENLGFNQSSTYSFTQVLSTTTYQLVSVNVAALIAEDNVFIRSDICDNKGTSDILQEIYSASDPNFASIVFQTQSVEGFSKKLNSNSKNVYRFTLTDSAGNIINLNGVNMLITLMLYKEQDIYSAVKSFLKYSVLNEN